jgi:saccharopine dehydrogenase (NAD+, L-lysine forming)
MKIGIIREGKTPPDSRVALTPKQCHYISEIYHVDIVIQPSPTRCYSDEEYRRAGLRVAEEMDSCDVLLGVKEVKIADLIPNKTYFFFSHTIKAQPYNQKLLQAIVNKNIHLIDYETIKNDKGERLIAFGHYAGMVGAHNGLWTYGERTGEFKLSRLKDCHDYREAIQEYSLTKFPNLKVVLTGTGRVANGAIEVLKDMGFRKVSPADYLSKIFREPVFTQLAANSYVRRKDGGTFQKSEFYTQPELYESNFKPYMSVSDIFINGIYFDPKAPAFFTKADMRNHDFKIEVIADVTCDIAPESSVPSTLFASTIADPVFGYNPKTEQETAAFLMDSIDIMSIDNLPNELPRDASGFFGRQFVSNVLPELLHFDDSDILQNASIVNNGDLTPRFEYLRNYLEGKS